MRQEYTVPATKGIAIEMKKDQVVRIIDVAGEQVADFVAYRTEDFMERLDPSVTMDALQAYRIGQNDVLYSNKYHPMFTILEDKVQCHDLLNSACRAEMYEFLYHKSTHRNCYDNLNDALRVFHIPIPHQHYPFNIFMHTEVNDKGKMIVKRPLSKAGDFISLRAEMNMIIGISACPCEESIVNGYNCTPLQIELE